MALRIGLIWLLSAATLTGLAHAQPADPASAPDGAAPPAPVAAPDAAPIPTPAPEVSCFDELRAGRRVSSLPGKPVTVLAGIDIIAFREIDGATETFGVDFYLVLRWKDPRLVSASNPGMECSVHPDEVWAAPVQLWGPRHEFINLRTEDKNDNASIELRGDGTVRYSTRISGTFDAPFSLADFPFDDQTLSLHIESSLDRDDVVFAPLPRLAGGDKAKDWSEELPQWLINNLQTAESTTFWVSADAEFSRFTLSVTATRRYGFYIWKVFVPLLLIIFLSWTVFWMSSDHFDGQMAVSITCLLALIAFNFVIGGELPKISYLTALDWGILLAYIFVFLAALENVVVHTFARADRVDDAIRVEVISRWLFPVCYVAANAALLLVKT